MAGLSPRCCISDSKLLTSSCTTIQPHLILPHLTLTHLIVPSECLLITGLYPGKFRGMHPGMPRREHASLTTVAKGTQVSYSKLDHSHEEKSTVMLLRTSRCKPVCGDVEHTRFRKRGEREDRESDIVLASHQEQKSQENLILSALRKMFHLLRFFSRRETVH